VNKYLVTKVQKVALAQVMLLSLQVLLGVVALVNVSTPDTDSSINTSLQVGYMLFMTYLVMAVPAMISAWRLLQPATEANQKERRVAFRTQQVLFFFCIVLIIPSTSLAFNGFVFFAIDCLLGMIFWLMISRERFK